VELRNGRPERLSGKTISRIDIGYDQPGGSGNYSGYVDDINIHH